MLIFDNMILFYRHETFNLTLCLRGPTLGRSAAELISRELHDCMIGGYLEVISDQTLTDHEREHIASLAKRDEDGLLRWPSFHFTWNGDPFI